MAPANPAVVQAYNKFNKKGFEIFSVSLDKDRDKWVDAIAQDGAENYVFRADAEHFDRQPVHVEHRDTLFAVIAQDGSLKPGDQIALNGAQQMHLALKNKSGGAIDPHAGHQH